MSLQIFNLFFAWPKILLFYLNLTELVKILVHLRFLIKIKPIMIVPIIINHSVTLAYIEML